MANIGKSNQPNKRRPKKSFQDKKLKGSELFSNERYFSEYLKDGKIDLSFQVNVWDGDKSFITIPFSKKYKKFNVEKIESDIKKTVIEYCKKEFLVNIDSGFRIFIKDIRSAAKFKVDRKNILPEQRENADRIRKKIKKIRDQIYYWEKKIKKYKLKQKELDNAESSGMDYDTFFELNMKYTQIILEAEKELKEREEERLYLVANLGAELLEISDIEITVKAFPIYYEKKEGVKNER
jgi:hypothetical protein